MRKGRKQWWLLCKWAKFYRKVAHNNKAVLWSRSPLKLCFIKFSILCFQIKELQNDTEIILQLLFIGNKFWKNVFYANLLCAWKRQILLLYTLIIFPYPVMIRLVIETMFFSHKGIFERQPLQFFFKQNFHSSFYNVCTYINCITYASQAQ